MSGRPRLRPALVRAAPWVALVVGVALVLLVALGPALTRSSAGSPGGDGHSPAVALLTAADPTVVAAPQPRTPGPLLLPIGVAVVIGLTLQGGRARSTTAGAFPSRRCVGLDRWRARLVGAPPALGPTTSN
jgi:hypothetical protein